MKNFNIFTNIIDKLFNGQSSYKIQKSQKVYNFISCEYPNYFSKDNNDCYIIPNNERNYKETKISQKINLGSASYSYFMSEYRENKQVCDSFGNIILNDEFVKTR